jgi:aminopeptidase-like protein
MISDKYYNLAKKKLFKINRSITGKGTQKTLEIIKNCFPNLKIKRLKSGLKVYDWKIPPEWNVKSAFIEDKNNKKILDIKKNNLHLIGYSTPINKYVSKDELLKKIFTHKTQKNAIPYLTTYYKKNWGFCDTKNNFNKIKKKYFDSDKFRVVIDSKLNSKGYLNYGELVIGDKNLKEEILISTYVCHPSMANNELSGPIVAMSLIDYFKKKSLKKKLRFIFIPETIGSISYINKNFNKIKNYLCGFNLTCLGDNNRYSCIFSQTKDSVSDKAVMKVSKKMNLNLKKYNFKDAGSDERQFNFPGINLGMTTLCRSKFGNFKEYHTSLDDFKFVTKQGIRGSFKFIKNIIEEVLDNDYPKARLLCEPMLQKKNLIKSINRGGEDDSILKFLWFANGKRTLNEISKEIGCNINKTRKIEIILKKNKLLV